MYTDSFALHTYHTSLFSQSVKNQNFLQCLLCVKHSHLMDIHINIRKLG